MAGNLSSLALPRGLRDLNAPVYYILRIADIFFTGINLSNTKKLRIAFVSQPFEHVDASVLNSSLSIWTYQVARRLTSSCDFIVYTRNSRSQEKIQWHEQIQYRRFSVALEDLTVKAFKLIERLFGYPSYRRPFFASGFYYLGYILRIAYDLRKQHCDIVHIHNFSQFIPIIRAFNPDIKIVLHMHCEWSTQLDQALVERRLRQVDLILGCSEFITGKIRSTFPNLADRCHTIYNGVDVDRFSRNNRHLKENNRERLLYVGRISPEKGLHVLLDAFQNVVEDYPELQLEFVGPSGAAPFEFIVLLGGDEKVTEMASFYNHLTKREGNNYNTYLNTKIQTYLGDQVSFSGSVPQSQLVDYYLNAEIFIYPSLWDEPFGMPIIEAMACQVPIVTTLSGGIVELVETEKTGLLVERGDAEALSDAILRLLSDKGLRESMGEAGRQRVLEQFTWEHIAQELLHQYKSIC